MEADIQEIEYETETAHADAFAPVAQVAADPNEIERLMVESEIPFTSYCFAPNIAFRGRNKSYGGYLLRKLYQRRLVAALTAGSVLFTLGVASPILYKTFAPKGGDEMEFSRVVELKKIEPPPLDPKQQAPPPPVEPPPPPKVSTVRFVPPEVAHDEEVAEEEIPPPQDELKEVQAAAVTQEGDPNANPNDIIVEDAVNEEAQVVGTPEPPKEEEVFLVVEVMPEILGGSQEVYKHLEYPELARKAGIEGLVVVQVVVEPNGTPSQPTIARSVADVLDEAAINAVMQLKFIPGKQRGTAVRVKYAIPIRFRLRDESTR